MHPEIAHSLSTLPDFLAYFALAIVMTGVFVVVYLWITPYDELKLIRNNDEAAAISFCARCSASSFRSRPRSRSR